MPKKFSVQCSKINAEINTQSVPGQLQRIKPREPENKSIAVETICKTPTNPNWKKEKVATHVERKWAKENPKVTRLSKYWPKMAPHQVTSLDRSVEKLYQTYKQRFDTRKTTNTYTCREKTARAISSRNVGDTCDHVFWREQESSFGKKPSTGNLFGEKSSGQGI